MIVLYYAQAIVNIVITRAHYALMALGRHRKPTQTALEETTALVQRDPYLDGLHDELMGNQR